jgi:hypothetical protein
MEALQAFINSFWSVFTVHHGDTSKYTDEQIEYYLTGVDSGGIVFEEAFTVKMRKERNERKERKELQRAQ